MDKEWVEEMSKDGNPLEDPTLTRKDKLFSGYYSFPLVSRLMEKKLRIISADLKFLKMFLLTKRENISKNEEVGL